MHDFHLIRGSRILKAEKPKEICDILIFKAVNKPSSNYTQYIHAFISIQSLEQCTVLK